MSTPVEDIEAAIKAIRSELWHRPVHPCAKCGLNVFERDATPWGDRLWCFGCAAQTVEQVIERGGYRGMSIPKPE